MSCLVAFLSALLFNMAPSPAPSSPSPSDLKDMIVYGQGFAFSVREPDGWVGHAPADVGAGSVSFYRASEDAKTATTIIWIQVMDDDGPDVAGDLTADMDHWKAKYPDMAFEDLVAPSPQYKTFSKLYIVSGEDPSYVSYVDPGSATKLYYIVSMQPLKRRATADELAAFDEVVASLRWVAATVAH
jgi:hypothetical protein